MNKRSHAESVESVPRRYDSSRMSEEEPLAVAKMREWLQLADIALAEEPDKAG